MASLNVNTGTFKSHSLRGAVATHLLKQGLPMHWVQARGGWRDLSTLQEHYNRAHQDIHWEQMLRKKGTFGEPAEERHCASSVAFGSKLSYPKPTKEGERGGKREHEGHGDCTTGRQRNHETFIPRTMVPDMRVLDAVRSNIQVPGMREHVSCAVPLKEGSSTRHSIPTLPPALRHLLRLLPTH